MSIDDTLGGFVLDPSALAALGGGENIYATTWADRAAVRGIVLLVPAAALSEAWQQIRRHDPGHVEQMRGSRWATGYEYGLPLLHMLDRDARRESSVPFITLAEAWVLDGLRRAGVRPSKIRPGLDELKRQFGAEYVLMAPELATDGVDLLWDFSRTKAGEGLIEARSGQHVIREIVADYLTYLTLGEDNLPESLRLQAAMPF